jgi:hypothetical protein
MPTLIASGTQAATIDTTHTLATDTASKVYVLAVDTVNMVAGDIVELTLLTKCLTGGTERVAYRAIYAHAQAEPMKYSVPVPANISCKATLQQTDGTGRSFPWALLAL